MAVNVTYLLGAGASCERLPLVKEVKVDNMIVKPSFGTEILILASRYESLKEKMTIKVNDEDKKKIDEVTKSLRFLGENSIKFSSPDTFIKSLSLQGENDKIENVKKALSFFLTVKQHLDNNLPDSRYIPFLASILETKESKVQIPENINILSWNYDFQLELALSHFENFNSFADILKHFKIAPNIETKELESRVVHLNGIAGIMKNSYKSETMFREIKASPDPDELLIEFLRVFEHLGKNYDVNDLLSFAWELDDVNHERIQMAKRIMQKTKILVIIGYSFPFFNRKVDIQLLEPFIKNNDDNELHELKIYIQNPSIDESRIQFLRQRFGIEDKIVIEPLTNTTQFFLPPEL